MIERTPEDEAACIDSLRQIEMHAASKVKAERAGAGDVWPAGWTVEQIEARRAIGEKFLADNPGF